MYQPCRPRPKLTDITRTRNGCLTCRRRKKRCDEGKPECTACLRLGLRCEPPETRILFHDKNVFTPSLMSPESIGRNIRRRKESTDASPKPESAEYDSGYKQNSRANELSPDIFIVEKPNEQLQMVDSRNRSQIAKPLDYSGHLSSPQDVSSPSFSRYPMSPPTDTSTQSFHMVSIHEGVFDSRQPATPYSLTQTDGATCNSIANSPAQSITMLSTTSQEHSRSITQQGANYDKPDNTIPETPVENWFNEPTESVDDSRSLLTGDTLNNTLEDEDLEDKRFSIMRDRLYLRHWKHKVMDSFPKVFEDMMEMIEESTALKKAILALGAIHMANTQVEIKQEGGKSGKYLYGPQEVHLQAARLYYNSAMRALAEVIDSKNDTPILILATLLLFIYIEIYLGSFRGQAFHENGVERLMSTEYTSCYSSSLGRRLIYVWIGLRAHTWVQRLSYSVLGLGRYFKEHLNLDIEEIIGHSPDARRERIVVSFAESSRSSYMVLMERYVGRGDQESISARCIRDYTQRVGGPFTLPPWRSKVPVPDEDYIALLNHQRKRLDAWHSELPLDELPIDSFGGGQLLDRASSLNEIRPLKFHSHGAAMNYLYYLSARAIQSIDLLNRWTDKDLDPTWKEDGMGWVHLFLRAIAGIDLMACVEQNTHTYGVTNLMFALILRCPRSFSTPSDPTPDLLHLTALDVSKKLYSLCAFREGDSGILLFQDLVQVFQESHEKGKDIFTICYGSADLAWTSLYSHRYSMPCLTYGKDRNTGKFFSEVIDPERPKDINGNDEND